MLESTIENYLTEQVIKAGGDVRKTKWIGRRGAPDRVVFGLNPPTIWVEVKAPGELVSKHQDREHARMRKLGQTVLVIDTKLKVDAFINLYARENLDKRMDVIGSNGNDGLHYEELEL